MQLQVSAFVIGKLHVLLQGNSTICLITYIPWFSIKGSRCFPISKFHFGTGFKVQRKLATFGSKPKTVFTSICVHVCISRSGECFVIHPSKTQAFFAVGSRGKYFSLVFRRYNNCCITIISFQNSYAVIMLL